ncbi:MAG: hypothetical protein HQK57_02755 [Deltaproteobacteria bacterium]|nr:hypothetical protein [Deltaproteobacteria bacterium]
MQFDHANFKIWAKKLRCRSSDLFALAVGNDPFSIGAPGQLALAEWFAGLWEQFGYREGVHLRRVHYQIISQSPAIKLPNGKPYENTDGCWNQLDLASKYARYQGLVDPGAFDDRRSSKPFVHAQGLVSPTVGIDYGYPDFNFRLPELPNWPGYELSGFQANNRYVLEIWAEKSTMNDILKPLCEINQINLVTGVGEISITHVKWLMDRITSDGRPWRIFYISDFDPAGRSMPTAVSRKIEKFVRDSGKPLDIRLMPIVLTPEQCQEYRLPRTPIKETELRAGRFEERFGEGATELDALEALYPGELRKIILAAVNRYRDPSLNDSVRAQVRDVRERLNEIEERVIGQYQEEISQLKNEYSQIKDEFSERMDGFSERFFNVWQAIHSDLSDIDIELGPLPEDREADEPGDVLYDSNRDYFKQLAAYKRFQGKKDVSCQFSDQYKDIANG